METFKPALCVDCPKLATEVIGDTPLCDEHYQIAIGELEAKEDNELNGD